MSDSLNGSRGALVPSLFNHLDSAIFEIEGLTSCIKETIRKHQVNCQIWSVERTTRGQTVEKISINELNEQDGNRGIAAYDLLYSVDTAIVHNKIEVINDFSEGSVANVPFRVVGVIVVDFRVKSRLIDDCTLLNKKKDDLKAFMREKVPSPHQRKKYYKAARPGLLVQSLYRHINIAPDNLSSITYRWEDKSTAPTVLERTDIEKLIGESATKNQQDGMSEDKLIQLDRNKLPRLDNDREFVRVEFVKAHPIQTIRYVNDLNKPYFRSENGRCRKQIRATSPLIVFSGQQFNHGKLKDYSCKTTRIVPATYVPVIPQLRIYHREKVKEN